MELNKGQLGMLATFKDGRVYQFFENEAEDEVVHYLLDNGLIHADVTVKDDYYIASQEGKALVDNAADRCSRQAYDDHIKDVEARKSRRRGALNTVLAAVATFLAALLAEHFFWIIDFIRHFFSSP